MLSLPLPKPYPRLLTPRLILREHTLADAADVRLLAGEREVAVTTRFIPHPYPEGIAEKWLNSLPGQYERGEAVHFGICLRDETAMAEGRGDPRQVGNSMPAEALIGSLRLSLNLLDDHVEMGYWIGLPYWNNGYCTEAAAAALAYAFDSLHVERVYANYLARNPASGRVLAKLGMKQEGNLRHHRHKLGQYEDLIVCGILRSEYLQLTKVRAQKKRGRPKAEKPS